MKTESNQVRPHIRVLSRLPVEQVGQMPIEAQQKTISTLMANIVRFFNTIVDLRDLGVIQDPGDFKGKR